MKRGIFVLYLIALIFAMNFLSADFDVGDPSHSITKTYFSGGDLKGWINLSLDEEESDSMFEDSFGNSLSLIDLLRVNDDSIYSCEPIDCKETYEGNNGGATKSFGMNEGDTKLIALKINEDIVSINSIKFQIESNAQASCDNQIKIDILKDGKIDSGNTKVSTTKSCSSSRDHGCFDEDNNVKEYIIEQTKHCQRITLQAAAGYRLGAWIKKVSDGDKIIEMSLFNMNGNPVDDSSCEIDKSQITTSGNEVFCEINYSNTRDKEYYVCIDSDNGDGTYRIQGYIDEEDGCGFYGTGLKEESASYRIFAERKGFAPVGVIDINNTLPNGESFALMVKKYIDDKYEDCDEGCVVPIEILSGEDQIVTIKNLELDYTTGGGRTIENKIYDASEEPILISTDGFEKIYLNDGNFTIPDNSGEETVVLELDNDEIFEEDISIGDSPEIEDLTPTKVYAAYPTKFTLEIDSDLEIETYEWDFGDNQTIKNKKNTVVKTYNKTGEFEVIVAIKDDQNAEFSKKFIIDVISPKNVLNESLEKEQEKLEDVKEQIENLQTYYQDGVNDLINTSYMENELKDLQIEYSNANSEEEYIEVARKLFGLEIPKSISTTGSGKGFSFQPKKENINLGVLSSITGEEYDSSRKDDYKNSMIVWKNDNLQTSLDFEEISVNYDLGDSMKINFFDIDIEKSGDANKDVYFIIGDMSNLKFYGSYDFTEEQNYLYTKLDSNKKTIRFSTTEQVTFEDVPMFLSPKISELKLPQEISLTDSDLKFNWFWFIIIIAVIFLGGTGIYIYLQKWYKDEYEDYLFRNKNDLYNLIVYIQDSKKNNKSDNEIKGKLKTTGWNSEQIDYVLRKYSGERTGMVELPINNLITKIKLIFRKNKVPKGVVPQNTNPVNRNLRFPGRMQS